MVDTHFEIIASSLTVRSICSPLGPNIELDIDIDDALQMMELEYSPSRAIGGGGTVGIIWYDDLVNHGALDCGALKRLEPCDFLSADTNILDAISLFHSRQSNPHFPSDLDMSSEDGMILL